MTAAGFNNDAIRSLRSGFPELGTVSLDGLPVNAITAYLPIHWQDALLEAAADTGLDPWLIAAVARQESVFNAHARSPRGAVGVMQLLPSTAADHARALRIGVSPNLHDPALNLRLGASELARLVARFEALEPAVAAYNAGETRVRRWWSREPDRRRFVEMIPIPETYTYVRRVTYLSEAYRLTYDRLWRTRR
jgi:soluble lytic murein transglycosylase